MQVFRTSAQDGCALVGLGLRVLLLSAAAESATARRLAGFGGRVETEAEMFAALSAMIDDPAGYGLFVMECDAFGGLDAGRRAVALLGQDARRIPAILIGAEVGTQVFPEEPGQAVELRAPVSAVALRVAMEHAARGRLVWQAA